VRLDAGVGAALSEDALTLALLHDREPTAELLGELKAVGFPGNLALAPRSEGGRAAQAAMGAALSVLPDAPDASALDQLAADFAAIHLTGSLGASPSESFWLSDDHLVCQDPMFELRRLYAEAGLRAPDWRKRPDDHLVFQLHYLANRLAAARDAGAWRRLAAFLDEHLLRWLPDFAARVAQRADTALHAALARLTEAWCEELRELLADELGEPRPSREELEARLREAGGAEPEAVPLRFLPGAAGPSW
jgi:TorA maturation chaperone TorD